MTADQTALIRQARRLVGERVRVVVMFDIRGCRLPAEAFEGRLIALGRKMGPSKNTRPYCLVLDAFASGKGVPIIALRSVKSLEAVT